MAGPGDRAGFGLMETLAVLAILAILAAVILPSTAAVAAAARLQQAEEDLDRLIAAIAGFEQDDMLCPARFDQLIAPLQPGDTSLSGEVYSGGERNRWSGPYYNLSLPAGGIQVAVGTATGLRAIATDPVTPAIIIETDILDAAALDGKYDSGDGATTGAIRWTVLSGNLVEVEYRLVGLACAPGASG